MRAKTLNSRSDFEMTFDRGVIFWLNNVDDDDAEDVLPKLSKLEAPKDFNHDGIFLVDHKKMNFSLRQLNSQKENTLVRIFSLLISVLD
jgi:hypothetical protein